MRERPRFCGAIVSCDLGRSMFSDQEDFPLSNEAAFRAAESSTPDSPFPVGLDMPPSDSVFFSLSQELDHLLTLMVVGSLDIAGWIENSLSPCLETLSINGSKRKVPIFLSVEEALEALDVLVKRREKLPDVILVNVESISSSENLDGHDFCELLDIMLESFEGKKPCLIACSDKLSQSELSGLVSKGEVYGAWRIESLTPSVLADVLIDLFSKKKPKGVLGLLSRLRRIKK